MVKPVDWDEIYRTTAVENLSWYPGEPDDILREAVAHGWLKRKTILDVGCGQGTDTIYLASVGFQATGLDISPVACEIARTEATRRGVAPTFIAADALHMPFDDGHFDSVTDRGCFHSVPLAGHLLFPREVARILKRGGRYLYRNFCWKSGAPKAATLTEETVRQAFEPYFHFERFGEYVARGEGGRSAAVMHFGLLTRL
jgi:ubiquinone/menaquinone biosynthesis C-methylase UbiE